MKQMKEVTPDVMKELKRVIKFVLSTRDYGLKMEPKLVNGQGDKWSIVVYSDSDWAGNADTRVSATGYIHHLCDGMCSLLEVQSLEVCVIVKF
jgi:hypothetical protein